MDRNSYRAPGVDPRTNETTTNLSYEQLPSDDSHPTILTEAGRIAARRTLWNFILMSLLFSANHGCVVACLSLATARLGSTGAWQSGLLYLFYTLSSVLGATYIVKRMGARNATWLGMGLYCVYVSCFWVATRMDSVEQQRFAAYLGAIIGGVGAGFLWTAQGVHFGQAAEIHAQHLQQEVAVSTSKLAGLFAFIFLAGEVLLRLLSTVLVGIVTWEAIFGFYTIVTIWSTLGMAFVENYPSNETSLTTHSSIWYKVTAAGQLLWKDPKMKYMIGLNAVFGFTSAFLNSYINGQVLPVALHDTKSRYIGLLTSWTSAVAAAMSLLFGRLAPQYGKGPILVLGAVCFFGVVFPFVVEPDARQYGWLLLMMVYTFHGVGRATFEGTLKATFVDFFGYEKEGAFANIVLQNGLSGAIGYVLTFSLTCDTPSRYCIEYSNGTLHDVFSFELVVVVFAVLAIVGYLRAAMLHEREREDSPPEEEEAIVATNDDADSPSELDGDLTPNEDAVVT